MFTVSEAEAAAIRAAYLRNPLDGMMETLRLFPGITDPDAARKCARTIAGWTPLPDRRVKPGGGEADAAEATG